MMLQKLSTVLAEYGNFEPSWSGQPPDCVINNNRFGMLMHVVLCNEEAKPLYDFPIWLERTGAVCVPIDQEGKIVLLRNYRPSVAVPSRRGEFPVDDLRGCGRLSLELPRGFPEADESPDVTALREVEEETGYPAFEATFLGVTNTNTTYFPFSNRVYLVRVNSQGPRTMQVEDNERIDDVLVLTQHDVLRAIANGDIFCGMTKSALMTYFAVCESGSLTIPSSMKSGNE